MKRLTALFLTALIFMTVIAPINAFAAYEPPFEVRSKAAYIANSDTGSVIYEKNARDKIYPASTTKIMTAILALENVPDLSVEVKYKAYIQDEMYLTNVRLGGISLGGLLKGEVLSMEKLLYAALLPSANEAAMIIADYVGDGSIDYFVELMNKKAKEIGALDTNFANPHGLHDDDHYTTAYDMYLITKYAMEIPEFAKMVSTTYYNGGPTNLHETLNWNTTNKMMVKGTPYYNPLIKGVKTGTTEEGGRCLISTASRDGYNYLGIVMGGPMVDEQGKELPYSVNTAFEETTKLYNWIFETFKVKTVMEKGKNISETKLRLAATKNKDHLKVMSTERFTALIPVDIDVESILVKLDLPKVVNAPVKRGDHIGYATLMLGDEELGKVALASSETVEASFILVKLDEFNKIFQTFWFKFALIFVILIVIMYSILIVMVNKRRKQRRNGNY